MTEHREFRDGRRLRAADLNGEAAARDADLGRHLANAHPGQDQDRRLVGNAVTHPSGRPTVGITPFGVAAGIDMSVEAGTDALRLGATNGHRAAGPVTSHRADIQAKHALRLTSQTSPHSGAAPWSVRAIDVRADDDHLLARELRIELSTLPGSPPQSSRVAIGTVVGRDFSPIMTVDTSGTVTVTGDVEVLGSVSQGEIPADLTDPRFDNLLADLVAQRVFGAATTAENSMFDLKAEVASGSDAQSTTLSITLDPKRILVGWGAALEVQRPPGGTTRIRLLRVGNRAQKNEYIESKTTWSPKLSEAAAAKLVVAVAAFDTQGALAAQHVEVDVTGPLPG